VSVAAATLATLVLAWSTPDESVLRFCETPADCGADGVCVAHTCRTGADQAEVTPLYRIAVPPPVVSGHGRSSAGTQALADALHAQLLADLRWSGLYDVMPAKALSASWRREGASPAEVDRAAWQATGARRVMQIAVGPGKASQAGAIPAIKIRIRVVEIAQFGVVDLAEGARTLQTSEVRTASAAFVNALVGVDTGIPGAIGTAIVGSTSTKLGVKEIATTTTDGGGFTQVTRNGSLNLGPAWGPDGVVGWMSYASGNPDWVVDGKPFSARPGLNAAGAWSPNGRFLALSVAEAGNSEIILMDAVSGVEQSRLTAHRAVDTSPAWSPDGRRVAYVTDRTGKPNIWIRSLIGRALDQLTHNGYNTSPDWSPNGHSLVYVRQVGGGRFVIIRHDFATGEDHRLTRGRGSAESPSFSRDGRYIAYAHKIGKQATLWIMDADGERAHQVSPKSFFAPDWRKR
jgi:TolB protein